jgi:Tfp pilus assembly protein PilW
MKQLSSFGFSLVEMIIAILLTAIIVLGTFSALLMTKQDTSGGDNRILASLAERQLLEKLKNYQTADVSVSGPNLNDGTPRTWALPRTGGLDTDTGVTCSGPNCPAACSASASLPPNCSSIGGCSSYTSLWANYANGQFALLPCCIHNVSRLLPASLPGAVLCYTVTDLSSSSTHSTVINDQTVFTPQVQVYIQWTKY